MPLRIIGDKTEARRGPGLGKLTPAGRSSNPLRASPRLGEGNIYFIGIGWTWTAIMGADLSFGIVVAPDGLGIGYSASANVGLSFGAGGLFGEYPGNTVDDFDSSFNGWSGGVGIISGLTYNNTVNGAYSGSEAAVGSSYPMIGGYYTVEGRSRAKKIIDW